MARRIHENCCEKTAKVELSLRKNYPEAFYNLGAALEACGRNEEAVRAYQDAISLRPDYADARLNLALIRLSLGELPQGWEEYEWRWKSKHFITGRREFTQPQWDGRKLQEQTLLIHAEQGLGDTLQFIRYLPIVRQRVEKIVVQCQPQVKRLLEIAFNFPAPSPGTPGEGRGGGHFPVQGAGPHPNPPPAYREWEQDPVDGLAIVANGEEFPPSDFHIPLLSLPRIFGTTIDSIPNHVPYLRPDPADAAAWQHRLSPDADRLKVGLVWAGRKENQNDRNRSLALHDLAQLGQTPGVRFFSLQKGEQADQTKNPPPGLDLADWTADLHDFADTAALVANLDLMISADTSVAHLAGAMGKPVWVMLPFAADWRWMTQRDDSPWYPTMRLFRQAAAGDWADVIERIAENLREWVSSELVTGSGSLGGKSEE